MSRKEILDCIMARVEIDGITIAQAVNDLEDEFKIMAAESLTNAAEVRAVFEAHSFKGECGLCGEMVHVDALIGCIEGDDVFMQACGPCYSSRKSNATYALLQQEATRQYE